MLTGVLPRPSPHPITVVMSGGVSNHIFIYTDIYSLPVGVRGRLDGLVQWPRDRIHTFTTLPCDTIPGVSCHYSGLHVHVGPYSGEFVFRLATTVIIESGEVIVQNVGLVYSLTRVNANRLVHKPIDTSV